MSARGCCGLNHEGSSDASEESETVWTFSTTESLEGRLPLEICCEQQPVDCDIVDSVWNGELMDNEFAFAVKNACGHRPSARLRATLLSSAQGSATGTKAYY